MAIIPVDYAQINWLFSGLALPSGAEVTMGARLLGGGSPTTLAEAAFNAWADNMSDNQSSSVQLTGCMVKFGPNSTGPSGLFSDVRNGGESAASCPPNVAILFKKVSVGGGRKNRGRLYMPGPPEGSIDAAGNVGSPYITECQTGADGLFDDLTTAELEPVILHSDPGAPTTIVALTVEALCGTQRRRLRR